VGGTFASMGGQPRQNLAAIDATTGLATAWNPGADGPVYAIAANATNVYVGGDFTTMGGQSRSCLGAVPAASSAATSWNPNPSSTVAVIRLTATHAYIGGSFDLLNGTSHSYVAQVSLSTGLPTSWNPAPDFDVYSIEVISPNVILGGWFTTIGAASRNALAAVDISTALPLPWNPGVNTGTVEGIVYSFTVANGKLYAGGAFDLVSGLPQRNLVAMGAPGSATDAPLIESPRISLAIAPNPMREHSTVQFALPQAGALSMALYDVSGRCVRTLVNGERVEAGAHVVQLERGDLAAGVYFLRFQHDGDSVGQKVSILR